MSTFLLFKIVAPQSSNLTQPDLYLWGILKEKVYQMAAKRRRIETKYSVVHLKHYWINSFSGYFRLGEMTESYTVERGEYFHQRRYPCRFHGCNLFFDKFNIVQVIRLQTFIQFKKLIILYVLMSSLVCAVILKFHWNHQWFFASHTMSLLMNNISLNLQQRSKWIQESPVYECFLWYLIMTDWLLSMV